MSTAVNSTHTSIPTSSRVPSVPSNHNHPDSSYSNGHHHHHHETSTGQHGTTSMTKKGKLKKTTDPNEASNLIAAKISQLESDAAGDKEQEAEIGSSPLMEVSALRGCALQYGCYADVERFISLLSSGYVRFPPFCSPLSTFFLLFLPRAKRTIAMGQTLQVLAVSCASLLTYISEDREVKKATRELNSLTAKLDPLQKVDTIQRRYTELLASMKRLERENQKNKKRADLLQKERDHGRTDLNKTNMLKEKLEKLCRELQKDNNRLKAENKTLQDAEKDNHAAWDDKFKQVLWQLEGIQDAKDNPQAQVVQVEADELFKQRFRSLIDQYELRDLHFHSVLRTKELEVQYNMARFDREKKLAEAEIARSRALNAQVLTFSKTETELRNQLNIYVEKFKQVEDTLNNSNDLFLTFRKEMEEMSKKTKRLEKENMNLTRKHDLTNQNILKMAEERTKANEDLRQLRTKNEKLTSIINQMQKQGRGVASGMAGITEGASDGVYTEADLDGTESENEYEYEDEEGDDGDGEEEEGEGSEVEFNDDTEEEAPVEEKRPFGPPLPPTFPINGIANGVKH